MLPTHEELGQDTAWDVDRRPKRYHERVGGHSVDLFVAGYKVEQFYCPISIVTLHYIKRVILTDISYQEPVSWRQLGKQGINLVRYVLDFAVQVGDTEQGCGKTMFGLAVCVKEGQKLGSKNRGRQIAKVKLE